ncbi:MAG TPA: type III pantothenate kinase [Chitinophagaceae bacterium]|nr:type III pantothenate kinase [Chitinophagaceae bacterium]
MDTTLCFDFGNTRLKCGVFDGSLLTKVFALYDDSNATIEDLLIRYVPHKTILSSVINHNVDIENILSGKSLFHKLSAQSLLPFSTPVGKPETIGADRLALCAAAVYFYPGKNNLVMGLGSCITFNFINKYNTFLGGSISPGMEMRFRSMNTFTAKLPLIKAASNSSMWNFPLVGYDTRTNIISGVVLGMASEIDGIINLYKEKYDNLNVLLTGGDSVYFTPFLKNTLTTDPDLIFKGLYAISEVNNK